MAEPLPPIPPVPDVNDPLFNSLMAVRNSILSLYRDAAINDQTAQMVANAAEVRASTAALQAATIAANAEPSDASRWWQAMMCQFNADQHGADFLNTVRNKLGVGWMASQADAAVAVFKQRYPT